MMPAGEQGGNGGNDPRDKPKGNPYPQRGEVKKKIVKDISNLIFGDGGDGGNGGGGSGGEGEGK